MESYLGAPYLFLHTQMSHLLSEGRLLPISSDIILKKSFFRILEISVRTAVSILLRATYRYTVERLHSSFLASQPAEWP